MKSISLITIGLSLALSGCEKPLDNLELRAQRELDPIKLQQWAVHILPNLKSAKDPTLDEERLPNEIKTFAGDAPVTSCLAGWDGAPGDAILIMWGASPGHIGFIIGDPQFQLTSEQAGYPVRQWIPGVYCFEGD